MAQPTQQQECDVGTFNTRQRLLARKTRRRRPHCGTRKRQRWIQTKRDTRGTHHAPASAALRCPGSSSAASSKLLKEAIWDPPPREDSEATPSGLHIGRGIIHCASSHAT